MGFIKKEILIGFLVGLFATAMGFYLYVEYALEGTFEESLAVLKENSLYGQVLSIAAIPNLLAFFVFIKKRQDYRARGVLIATLVVAFLILVAQFV
ncbi:hypothetical protein UMM65_10685 [Aureibaculum sp. 2210JD6-5]|uniref:hypothetical protein n=1 Tax=Aureibaculum sp. 2210JD6-5 TaxID=3103957 RepID=UPI002AAE4B08|nr:hypothetical protein [Aureibaculum sp. 2210JD6-5]MDY7395710.1 hypothetical protein [Aureibaculum sp. 2210JD6-5]